MTERTSLSWRNAVLISWEELLLLWIWWNAYFRMYHRFLFLWFWNCLCSFCWGFHDFQCILMMTEICVLWHLSFFFIVPLLPPQVDDGSRGAEPKNRTPFAVYVESRFFLLRAAMQIIVMFCHFSFFWTHDDGTRNVILRILLCLV